MTAQLKTKFQLDCAAVFKGDKRLKSFRKTGQQMVLQYTEVRGILGFSLQAMYVSEDPIGYSYGDNMFYNFDLKSGKKLAFQDLFALRKKGKEWELFLEVEEMLSDDKQLLPDEFLIQEDGVTIAFAHLDFTMYLWQNIIREYFKLKRLQGKKFWKKKKAKV